MTAVAIFVFRRLIKLRLVRCDWGKVESKIRLAAANELVRESRPAGLKTSRSQASAFAVPRWLRLSLRAPAPLDGCAVADRPTFIVPPVEFPPAPAPPDPTICGSQANTIRNIAVRSVLGSRSFKVRP